MRGRFAVVVGPDGVGKTTFAAALAAALGPDTRYFHFRPPVRAPLALGVPEMPPLPKARGPVFAPLGWVRLALGVVRFWTGYMVRVRPALRSGASVIGDRWAYGYVVQPQALRFGGPEWLARAAIGMLPRPDVVYNLSAPPEVVTARKQELTVEEVDRELEAWRRIPARVVTLDATQTTSDLVTTALASIRR